MSNELKNPYRSRTLVLESAVGIFFVLTGGTEAQQSNSTARSAPAVQLDINSCRKTGGLIRCFSVPTPDNSLSVPTPDNSLSVPKANIEIEITPEQLDSLIKIMQNK